MWLYPRWKSFGSDVFKFIPGELSEPLMEKLFLIEQYAPAIADAQEKRR